MRVPFGQLAAAALVLTAAATRVDAFSQRTPVFPEGHEWITVEGAVHAARALGPDVIPGTEADTEDESRHYGGTQPTDQMLLRPRERAVLWEPRLKSWEEAKIIDKYNAPSWPIWSAGGIKSFSRTRR